MRGETVIWNMVCVMSAAMPETVTALPPAVTVKAEAGGRFAGCRFSENSNWTNDPLEKTFALSSAGGGGAGGQGGEQGEQGRGGEPGEQGRGGEPGEQGRGGEQGQQGRGGEPEGFPVCRRGGG